MAFQPKAFLSHSSKDKPFVRFLVEDLRACGCEIWMDELDLVPGDLLREKILVGIQKSTHLLVCVTAHSQDSTWVQEEIELARKAQSAGNPLRLVPLVFGLAPDSPPPAIAREVLYVDFRTPAMYDLGLRSLMTGMGRDAEYARTVSYIDADRRDHVVNVARRGGMSAWLCEYLGSAIGGREDPTERYWSFLALAEIGGASAKHRIEELAAKETNSFSLLGARQALEVIH